MNFEQVLRALLQELEQRKIRYAVIGGFALGLLGVPRATMDLDWLVHRDDLDQLDAAMRQLGYQRHIRTENATHYRHPDRTWGAVDVLHAFRKSSMAMLARARSYPIFDGQQTIRALEAEDVIGLKVQAIANDPTRRAQDQADIEALAAHYGNDLDWNRVEEYYALFELEKEGSAYGVSTVMLSEEEQRELREMAKSSSVREEFRRLKAASQVSRSTPVNLDQLLDFLSTMSRLCPTPPPPRPFVPYARVLL